MTYRRMTTPPADASADTWWAKLCARLQIHAGITPATVGLSLAFFVITSALVLWIGVAFSGVTLQGDIAYVTSRDTE